MKRWTMMAVLVAVMAAGCTTQTDDTLYCGEYTQANADGTNGCEVLPEYRDRLEPIPACVSEDSGETYPCMWDATLHGNGEGRSFVRYDVEHVEFVDDIAQSPVGYDVMCRMDSSPVCWSK